MTCQLKKIVDRGEHGKRYRCEFCREEWPVEKDYTPHECLWSLLRWPANKLEVMGLSLAVLRTLFCLLLCLLVLKIIIEIAGVP